MGVIRRAIGPTLFVAVVAIAAAALVAYEPEVAGIDVTPASLALDPGATQQLAATVRTRFPDPLGRARVRWSVAPASAGGVDAMGLFRAAETSGSGSVTAAAGGATATIPLVVSCPRSTSVGGIAFTASCAGSADVYFESGLAPAAAQAVLRAADADVPAVEKTFARPFARRPLVYVFSTRASFARGLSNTLANGNAVPTAAVEADGVYVSGRDVIGVDWEEAGRFQPFTTLRHELTHKMLAELTKSAASLPAWVDEGSARLEEETVAGTEWLVARERYFAISMAATDTLFPLADLADVRTWGSRAGVTGDHQYHEAAMAVSFLRDDLGMPKLLQLLGALGDGTDFATAYESVSGRPFDAFAGAFPDRLRALAKAPGVAAAPNTPSGAGLTLVLYGFTPSTSVTVTLTGSLRDGRSVDTMSAFGTGLLVAGAELPAGAYTITATGANGRVTITARKP